MKNIEPPLLTRIYKCLSNFRRWQAVRKIDKAWMAMTANNINIDLASEMLFESGKQWDRIMGIERSYVPSHENVVSLWRKGFSLGFTEAGGSIKEVPFPEDVELCTFEHLKAEILSGYNVSQGKNAALASQFSKQQP